jgi:hypothetical protein
MRRPRSALTGPRGPRSIELHEEVFAGIDPLDLGALTIDVRLDRGDQRAVARVLPDGCPVPVALPHMVITPTRVDRLLDASKRAIDVAAQ